MPPRPSHRQLPEASPGEEREEERLPPQTVIPLLGAASLAMWWVIIRGAQWAVGG